MWLALCGPQEDSPPRPPQKGIKGLLLHAVLKFLLIQAGSAQRIISSPPRFTVLAQGMNAGISALVLLVALSSSCCFSHPTHGVEKGQSDGGPADEHTRHTRAVSPSGQLDVLSKTHEEDVEEDSVRRLNELLARLVSRKGSYRRSPSLNSRSNHRIKDRDYLGWMDFGRRSAEEYEYSS